jgi:NhaP-type Na+/H+ or K+/H+ antiporter
VLAGDVGVGPPGEGSEREPNFALTGEAGLNDGLAFPFLFLGLFIAGPETGWFGSWLLADVVYAIGAGVLIGALVGYGIGALAVRLRDRDLLSARLDGWLAIPSVLCIYGLAEVAGAYGFIAAFVGGLAFRRYERTHEYNRGVHDGAELIEKVAELVVILALGSMLSFRGLEEPGLTGWLLVPLLLVVIRPLAVVVGLAGSNLRARERAFVAWFGVRGIGSLYYVAVAAGAGVLTAPEIGSVTWTAIAVVVVSIVVHGVSAAPLSRRLLTAADSDRAD